MGLVQSKSMTRQTTRLASFCAAWRTASPTTGKDVPKALRASKALLLTVWMVKEPVPLTSRAHTVDMEMDQARSGPVRVARAPGYLVVEAHKREVAGVEVVVDAHSLAQPSCRLQRRTSCPQLTPISHLSLSPVSKMIFQSIPFDRSLPSLVSFGRSSARTDLIALSSTTSTEVMPNLRLSSVKVKLSSKAARSAYAGVSLSRSIPLIARSASRMHVKVDRQSGQQEKRVQLIRRPSPPAKPPHSRTSLKAMSWHLRQAQAQSNMLACLATERLGYSLPDFSSGLFPV